MSPPQPLQPEQPFASLLRRRHRGPVCTIVGLVLLLYGSTVTHDFVNWDDTWYVVENPLIKSWHPANLWQMATEPAVRNFAPLTQFSLLVDHSVFGLWAGGYKLENALWHALNSVLVYWLIGRLSGRHSIALLTAALFAVHPVHVESVAWISSRKGLLSAAFILASLICWLRPNRSGRDELWGTGWLALALLSKAIAVVVPAVVLLYDLWIVRKKVDQALVRQFIPGLLALFILLLNMGAQTTLTGGIRSHLELGKFTILAIDLVLLWFYLAMLVAPADLNILYDFPTSGIALPMLMAAIAWLKVGHRLWSRREQHPWPLLGFSVFLLFLLPVLNLFPITTLMNDRYLYLPSIPILALAATATMRVVERLQSTDRVQRLARHAVACASLCLVVTYSWITLQYVPVWKDGMSLWTHAYAKAPQLPVVRIQMANTLHQAGNTDRAIAILETTLTKHDPDELDRERIERKLREWR